MQSYKDVVGAKMTNQITPEISTWNGNFFEGLLFALNNKQNTFQILCNCGKTRINGHCK